MSASDPPVRKFQPIHSDLEFERFIGEFTSYEQMKDFRYGPDTMKLERMVEFARQLGDPQLSYPSIHVAGTKGKGSTCLMVERLLASSGKKVGSYLSPHVEQLRERIRIGCRSIGEGDLCATFNRMLDVLEEDKRLGEHRFPTFFELMTALAMSFFQAESIDLGIFEVGLGGRLDATNILPSRWTAITSIGLEHTQKLGNTLTQIAWEKAGIIKEGTPLFLGPVPPEARVVILETARGRKAPVVEVQPDSVRLDSRGELAIEGFGGGFPQGAVRGPGLRSDLALALAMWREILGSAGGRPGAAELRHALASLELPARVEVFEGPPPVIIDGAHTPESIASLRQALEEIRFPRPRRLILSIASDKRMVAILQEIQGLAEEYYFTRSDPGRSIDPGVLAGRFQEMRAAPPERIFYRDDPNATFQEALASGCPTVVTGSFFLAGRLRPLCPRCPARRPLAPPQGGREG